MKKITTKFERNQYLRTKSILHQIGWLDAETSIDLERECRRRGGYLIPDEFIAYELSIGRYEPYIFDTDKSNFFKSYMDGGIDHSKNSRMTTNLHMGTGQGPLFPFLPSCLNTTFLAMEGPIKDYGFTTEWKSLAIADGTIFMFDYGEDNWRGPDYSIDLEIEHFAYKNDATTYSSDGYLRYVCSSTELRDMGYSIKEPYDTKKRY